MVQSTRPGLSLKVDGAGVPETTSIKLQGVEIAHGVQDLRLYWTNDDITQAQLTINLSEIHIEEELLVDLICQLKSQMDTELFEETVLHLLGYKGEESLDGQK